MKKNKYGYTKGDLFVANSSQYFSEGSIVELYRDDNSDCPMFKLVKGSGGFQDTDKAYNYYIDFKHIYSPEAEETFEPFTLTLDTLEDFEVMKAIMHLHNKVSESSFFGMDWTPRPHKVKAFMMDAFDRLDTHRKGWSEYKKGEQYEDYK